MGGSKLTDGSNNHCRVDIIYRNYFYYEERIAKRDLDDVAYFAHKIILDALVEMEILKTIPSNGYFTIYTTYQSWVPGDKEYFFKIKFNGQPVGRYIKINGVLYDAEDQNI